jgi:protein-disulfide isomerase
MRRVAPLLLAAFGLNACAGSAHNLPQAAAAPAPVPTTSGALGSVGGTVITRDDLGADIRAKLEELYNESEQRRLHLLWVGFEDAAGRLLMAQEAKKRGVSVESLREKEVLARVTVPTEDEIQQFYDQNADRIGVDFKTAAPHIKAELVAERAQAVERAFIDRLREQTPVKYTLPVPNLPRHKVEVGDGPSWGKRDATVTIIEFSDFQCPYCARASVIIKKLQELYPNDLRVEFRDFPLAQHPSAREAAEAAHCAEEQGKFWEYHDLLFANARALDTDDLKKYAADANLDAQAFASCLGSDRPKSAVDASIALGQKAGVEGTPAIFINGIKLIGLLPLPLMQAFIEHELARK